MVKNERGTWQKYCWSSHLRTQREYSVFLPLGEPMENWKLPTCHKLNVNKLNSHSPQSQIKAERGNMSMDISLK